MGTTSTLAGWMAALGASVSSLAASVPSSAGFSSLKGVALLHAASVGSAASGSAAGTASCCDMAASAGGFGWSSAD